MSSKQILLLYTGLAVALTWPLILGITSNVPGDLGDSLLNMWILSWGAEHLPRVLSGALSWQQFWDANIFYPEPMSLAFSEHLFGQVLQILPIYWLTGNIILCYNLLFISSFALSAFGAYLLVRDLTGNTRAALIAGLIYGFLPYRIASIPHLQVMSSQWMPFALYGLNRYITTGSRQAFAVGTLSLVMQNWSCGYYLLYFAPFVPLFLIHRMWTQGKLLEPRIWVGLTVAAVINVALTVPFLIPYRAARDMFGFDRSLAEVYSFSASIRSYLTASENLWLYGKWLRASPGAEQELFLGFMPWLLLIAALMFMVRERFAAPAEPGHLSTARRIAIGLLLFISLTQLLALVGVTIFGGFEFDVAGVTIRARTAARAMAQFVVAFGLLLVVSRRDRFEALRIARTPAAMAAMLTVLAMLMSFGPNFDVYAFLYEHVPGFRGVRVTARYAMLVGLFLAVWVGLAAAPFLRSTRVAALIAVLIVAEGFAVPIEINRNWGGNEALPPDRVMPASQAPPLYRHIKTLPAGSAITEFPFGDPAWEIRYTYYAASHWKPITNGYSGNFSRNYKERVARLQLIARDPEGAWASLKDSGSTHAVIHRNAFADPAVADTVENWLKAHGAIEIARFDNDILLKL